MEVAIPHSLGKDTVRERLRTRGHLIGENIPGGMAEVTTQWPSEDRMAMTVSALGQTINAHVDIEDRQIVFVVDVPPALGFIKPIIEGALRQQGEKLIALPSS
jgi:hypothetical protein